MNEKKNNKNKYEKRLAFQQKMITRQSEQIEKLKNKLIEKDEIINSVTPLRNELIENINEVKKKKKEFDELIQEMKKMKSIVNKEVYKGRWWLIKWLIK